MGQTRKTVRGHSDPFTSDGPRAVAPIATLKINGIQSSTRIRMLSSFLLTLKPRHKPDFQDVWAGTYSKPKSAKCVAQAHSHGLGRPNMLSHPRQPIGVCLVTCPGLWATCLLAPLSTTRWPTPACRQKSVLTRRPFWRNGSQTRLPLTRTPITHTNR
jgi:hypothetical protein